jgi:sugar transferase (PEP-CTERM/EpsH1 system associated)
MRILVITDYLPFPLITGDRIRVYNLIHRIAEQHEVSVAGFLMTPDEADGVSHLKKFCNRVETVNLPRRHRLARIHSLIRYILAGIPFDFEFLDSQDLKRKIQDMVSSMDYDIVQIEHSRMALYLDALSPNVHAKSLLVFHNIASSQYDSISNIALTPIKRARAWLHSRMLRRWEPLYAERFDRCITVSEEDRRLLMTANPRLQVDVVPNGVDTKIYQPLALEETQPAVLFVGNMSYAPNSDGAIWFCNQILPYIRRVLPGIRAWIVGTEPPREVIKLQGDGVHVTGRVEDVVPYYRRSTVSVVPLRAGGGSRLKVLEAMALGRPIVSTTIGCEGLKVVDNQHLLIADRPEQFSGCVFSLLQDTSLYKRITGNARRLVEEEYSWEILASHLLKTYEDLYQ